MEVTVMEIRQTTEDASDVGSIPIARSINADDSIAFTSGRH